MLNEENKRKFQGATAHDSSSAQEIAWSHRINTFNFETCPDDFKKFIEETDLDELVYWKLKVKLEKQSAHKENEILKGVIDDVERPLFAIVLSKTNGNQSKAAELLGCNRNTLHRKLKEFLINPKDIKKTIKNKSLNSNLKANGNSSRLGFKKVSMNDAVEV